MSGRCPENGGEDLKGVREGSGGHLEEGVAGSGNSKCRGPSGALGLVCLSNSEEADRVEQGGH